MPRSPMRAHPKAYRAFLCCLHRIVAASTNLKTTSSAFIKRVLGLNQFWTVLNHPACSRVSTNLLVGGRHIDDIALEPYPAALEKQHAHRLHRHHLLHIKGSPTVNKA